jgi:hypothetical protein
MGATYQEIADHYQTNPNWLQNNKKDIIDAGKASMKLKLRKEQLRIALDPNHTKQALMLIYLGKVILGQRETTETIITSTDKNFEISFVDNEQELDKSKK